MPITATPYTQVYGPLSLTGVTCALWMDGADTTTMTTSGTTITRMNDKSGNGYNSTAIGGAPALTANAINGLPAISFNGSSYITGCNANTNTTGTFFVIATLASGQGAGQQYTSPYVFSRVVSGSSCYNEVQSINGLACQNPATSLVLSPQRTNVNGPTYTLSNYNTAFMHAIVCNGTTMAGYGNGSASGSTASSGNFAYTFYNIGSQTYSYAAIGYNYYWVGYIGEVIAFNNALSDPQRQQVEGYLAQKWGLTAYLPAGHLGLTQTLYNGRVYQSRVPLSLQATYYLNFRPTQTTGVMAGTTCTLWLDGADPAGTGVLPSNNSVLSTWADKSGNGLNMTGASGQPSFLTNAFNGKPTVSFTAIQGVSAQQLTNASTALFNSLTNLSVFVVMYIPGTTPNYPVPIALFNKVIIYMRGGSAGGIGPGNLYPWTYNGASVVYSLNNFVSVNNYYICCFQFNTNQSFFMNGDIGTGGPTPFSFGSGTNIPIYIGTSTYNTSDGFNGYLSEIIIYTSAISTTQRQTVESYLAQKWGLQGSLPPGNINNTAPAGLPPWESTVTRGLTPLSGIVATGGTIVTANGFRTHTFTTVGTTNFIMTAAPTAGAILQVLIVAGGGSGSGDRAAGGGAGGLIFTTTSVTQGTYPAIVGAGGTVGTGNVHGTDGSNSSFNGQVAIGGGSGGSHYQGNYIGNTGGSGGGGAAPGPGTPTAAGGTGTSGQGYGGGTGYYNGSICSAGGGGGAGAAGSNASTTKGGNGGIGLFITIGGNSAYYAGGGGGAGAQDYGPTVGGTGGLGGGGTAAQSASIAATPGTPNTGGGGAGAGNAGWPGNATNGGSGIVIISYPYP